MTEKLEHILKLLPDDPGVYMMKDISGKIIYVGKAKNLKNRVRSYFHSPSGHNAKTQALVSHICDIQYIVVNSEMEALLLENNLIKKYKPYYNILLKDSKGYPYLRMDLHEDFPKLEIARQKKNDGAIYFGPYSGGGMARDICETVLEAFPLRTCAHNLSQKQGRIRPCIKYDIGRCCGVCRADYSRENYRSLAVQAAELLEAGGERLKELLCQRMMRASERMEYEKAAEYRDRLNRLDSVLASQKVVLKGNNDLDILAASLNDGYAVIVRMIVRSGRMLGAKTEEYAETVCQTEAELIGQYAMQRYSGEEFIPPEILVSHMQADMDVLAQYLSQRAERKVYIHKPQRGEKYALMNMALKNVDEVMQKSLSRQRAVNERRTKALEELAQVLSLPQLPRRMECFDISHIQGTDTVASMVVLTDGYPDHKEYRRFKIKTVEGNNDFASMAEVISRRYKRALAAAAGDADSMAFAKLPNLIVIDGGKGQLSSACEILRGLGLSEIPIIGLAKRYEEIYLPGESESVFLGTDSPAVQMLQTIRDEAHRFAITYHRSLRNKRGLLSRLTEIPGIGEKRRKELFKQFGSVKKIQEAGLAELAAVKSMDEKSARAVYNFFLNDKKARSQEEEE